MMKKLRQKIEPVAACFSSRSPSYAKVSENQELVPSIPAYFLIDLCVLGGASSDSCPATATFPSFFWMNELTVTAFLILQHPPSRRNNFSTSGTFTTAAEVPLLCSLQNESFALQMADPLLFSRMVWRRCNQKHLSASDRRPWIEQAQGQSNPARRIIER